MIGCLLVFISFVTEGTYHAKKFNTISPAKYEVTDKAATNVKNLCAQYTKYTPALVIDGVGNGPPREINQHNGFGSPLAFFVECRTRRLGRHCFTPK